MKPRKTLSIYVLLVGVMGLLIVGGVFAFQLVDEATKSQLSTAQRELVKPLDGKIEDLVIENLSKRRLFSKEELLVVKTEVPTEASPSSGAAIIK